MGYFFLVHCTVLTYFPELADPVILPFVDKAKGLGELVGRICSAAGNLFEDSSPSMSWYGLWSRGEVTLYYKKYTLFYMCLHAWYRLRGVSGLQLVQVSGSVKAACTIASRKRKLVRTRKQLLLLACLQSFIYLNIIFPIINVDFEAW